MADMPDGLGVNGQRLWIAVTSEYNLFAHHPILLREACLVCDEIGRLQAFIDDADNSLHAQREAKSAVVELRLQRLLLTRILSSMRFPED